jgi:hypothetical protein
MRFGDYNSILYMMNRVRYPVFEGEGDAGAVEGDAGGEGDGGIATGTPPSATNGNTDPKAFSPEQQAEVNRIMAAEKKKHQRTVQKAVDEANALRSKAQLTATERSELDNRLDSITNEMRTKDEQAKRAAKKQKEAHQKAIESLTAEKTTWQQRYTESTIERSLTDAAAANNAFSPKQIVAILGRTTQLVEVLDDEGQPTGQLAPKVKYRAKDKEGKPVTLDLSPEDAVKRMKDEDEYLNLFRGEGSGGAGLRSQPGGKKQDLKNLAKDPAAYRKARKAGEVNF